MTVFEVNGQVVKNGVAGRGTILEITNEKYRSKNRSDGKELEAKRIDAASVDLVTASAATSPPGSIHVTTLTSKSADQSNAGSIAMANKGLAPLTAQSKFAHLFQEHSKEIARDFDTICSAVEQALKRQKEDVVIADKQKGIFTTKPTRVALFTDTWDQYWIVVERQNDSSTTVRFKVVTTTAGKQISKDRVEILPVTNATTVESKVKKFMDNVQKSLDGKK